MAIVEVKEKLTYKTPSVELKALKTQDVLSSSDLFSQDFDGWVAEEGIGK